MFIIDLVNEENCRQFLFGYSILPCSFRSCFNAFFSVNDTLGEIRRHPQAGAVVDAMMAKGASARGDVAEAVKDNPALQRMMGRMTMLSLLKQGGADEESIKQLNRILQGIKK